MSTRKQPRNFIQRLLKRLWQSFNALITGLSNGVLRSLMVFKRRSRQSQAGFVLPTVVMVMLVVALLTTAIVIRSFDRAKNASNYRIDQAVLNAATPALDRARAKIYELFSENETELAGNTPPEDGPGSISEVLSKPKYTFGDEKQLRLAYRLAGQPQTLDTAWKFPTDTDNNGKFDSFTLYGVYFRNPRDDNSDGVPDRARTPLEARALPQATGELRSCGGSSAASSGGTGGWYETDGQLKKAFFVYVASVPIAQADIAQVPATEQGKYEPYTGNKGFSALEMQQDQARIALDNNAVWYDDDLAIANVPPFRLNGRMFTNSNLMVANNDGDQIVLYQVSSPDSCFYKAENAKIVVAGNVAAGDITGNTEGQPTDSTRDFVKIHLLKPNKARPDQPANSVPSVNADNKTTTLNPPQVASNSNAYAQRLDLLVNAALDIYDASNSGVQPTPSLVSAIGRFPQEVKDNFQGKYNANDPGTGRSILTQVLKTYFAERLRRVSYQEVPYFTGNPLLVNGAAVDRTSVFAGGGVIAPPAPWSLIDVTNSQVPLKTSPTGGIELEATDPDKLKIGTELVEYNIGDRIQVGNALPYKWLKPDGKYAQPSEPDPLGVAWNNQAGTGLDGGTNRERFTRAEILDDLGDTSRGGFWEQAAAKSGSAAKQYPDLSGGLRVITGAGIYIDGQPLVATTGTGTRGTNSLLPEPPSAADLVKLQEQDRGNIKLPKEIWDNRSTPTALANYQVVWPDTMPLSKWTDSTTSPNGLVDAGETVKAGDLQMRATVVYHYKQSAGTQQEPIACISSYYDPSSPITAQNATGLPLNPAHQTTTPGVSNNGVNYDPTNLVAQRSTAATNLVLQQQAKMIFPDGRWVNEPLKRALSKTAANLSLEDIAAIDAANCALNILYGSAVPTPNNLVPDFAIQEAAFLDARQVKALHKRNTKTDGTLIQRDISGAATPIDRQTLQDDINKPERMQIANLGSLLSPGPVTADDPANTDGNVRPAYSLPIEQRQPLEIRVTQIDLGQLKTKTVGAANGAGLSNTQEYMIPNSGIIYASRDDALRDISDSDFDTVTNPNNPNYGKERGGSATDFQLDPTRRPNGIRLVNGANLARTDDYRTAEKGLILATDLPVYIKGSFNQHFKPGSSTLREEFIEKLADNYGNFYTRTSGTNGSNLDKGFACRPSNVPSNTCTDGGDQWRPARILSDAVTLLSRNFRDGYRQEGDFDLNNNAGNLAVWSRLKAGFWWNDFATSAKWYDETGANAGYPTVASSYVTNGVTPIQRRATFTEYRMEICRKSSVSECSPQDWKLEAPQAPSAGPSVTPGRGSGTTAPYSDTPTSIRYVPPGDRAYPRRVAFVRDAMGGLVVPDSCGTIPADCKPTPIAVDAAGANLPLPYDGNTTAVPAAVNNTLWYWTTGDNTDPSGGATGVSYNNTNKLYFPPFPAENAAGRKILLPKFPVNGAEALSDYALLVSDGAMTTDANCKASTNSYSLNLQNNVANCPLTLVTGLYYGFRTMQAGPGISVRALPALQGTPANPLQITLKAEEKTNIFTLPLGGILSDVVITLDRNTQQEDPIFVFRMANPYENSMDFRGNVKVKLRGVEPNNVFWVTEQGVRIFDRSDLNDPTQLNELVGNFITAYNYQGSDAASVQARRLVLVNSALVKLPLTNPILHEVRFLGFSTFNGAPPAPDIKFMTAMTKVDQPLLTPVLQLHSPQGTPANNTATAFGGQSINQDKWVQRVTTEEVYNAVFIMGDSPARPMPGNGNGETNGGLPNFPRFLEAWEASTGNANDDNGTDTNNKIKGSFIQFKKSIFATAPFEAIDDASKDNSLFFDSAPGTPPAYMADFTLRGVQNPEANKYRYRGGAQFRKAPYYRPPNRLWGYDVGLLSQTPDLFSRRFSNPSAGTPNEYFREVSRDDRWVQSLLCAAQEQGTNFQWAIADARQRPSACQTAQPGAIYNNP